jgi:hypothetical protein
MDCAPCPQVSYMDFKIVYGQSSFKDVVTCQL